MYFKLIMQQIGLEIYLTEYWKGLNIFIWLLYNNVHRFVMTLKMYYQVSLKVHIFNSQYLMTAQHSVEYLQHTILWSVFIY